MAFFAGGSRRSLRRRGEVSLSGFFAGGLTPLLTPEGRGIAPLRCRGLIGEACASLHINTLPSKPSKEHRSPAPAPAGLFRWACWRVCGLLGGNVSQFCALFRLFWRKRDWNCATLPHPGDDTPPEPPRSSAQLSSLPVIWQNSPRFCSSVVVDFAFARSKTQYRNIGTVHYPSRLSFRYHQLRI